MPSAQVNGEGPSGVLHFEADTDDELFALLGRQFQGRWEGKYHSLYDYLEDRGMILK